MRRIARKPAPDLVRQIEMFWSVTSRGGSGRSLYEVLPDSGVHLILRFSSCGCRMVLLGQATEKACIEIDESSDYFGIRFHPGHVPRLADIRPADLIDNHVDLPGIDGVSIDSLADRMLSSQDPALQQRVMEDLVRGTPPLIRDERCRQAISLLKTHGGRLHVDELAAGIGLHVRSLERLFCDHLGMTPKRLARLVRLQHLASRIRSGKAGNLTELAYACGYADQSHMIKDFKEMTGRLPGENSTPVKLSN